MEILLLPMRLKATYISNTLRTMLLDVARELPFQLYLGHEFVEELMQWRLIIFSCLKVLS